jgi:PAS domain S-box-containing protein
MFSKKPKKEEADNLLLLRRAAEKLVIPNKGQQEDGYAEKDLKWLLHELQVQKIELEMQNEQLRQSNEGLEMQRSNFAGIYNLAPVGFFILDLYGMITEVNSTGCKMMDISKKNLIGTHLSKFIRRQDTEIFVDFLESIQLHEARQSCQLTMLKKDGKFFAQVEGIVPVYNITENIRCYIAVIDITDQKNAKAKQEKQILKATLAAQENERKRISEALHNSVGQLLYGIKLKIDRQSENSHNGDFQELLDQAIKETRNISFELAPSILKDFGLRVTLDEMAERLSDKGLTIRIRTNLNKRLELSMEVDLFRMIQELVNNSIKHAASMITMELKSADIIIVEVTDNGTGFSHKKNQAISGSGLAAIRNKLTLYNGEMNIESKGKGSLVRLILNELKP